jgi:DNA-binding response OmpR family regulator
MFARNSILLVESDPYLALDLSLTIEQLEGRVSGPVRKLADATAILDSEPIRAAIVDCHIDGEDMLPLADLLASRALPFVLHASAHLAEPQWSRHSDVPVLIKPLQPRTVLARLLSEMRKHDRRAGVA